MRLPNVSLAVAVLAVAVAGCSGESAGASEESDIKAATRLVGSYTPKLKQDNSGDFSYLELQKGGRYFAMAGSAPLTSMPEQGSWKSTSSGGLALHLRPKDGKERVYGAALSAADLELALTSKKTGAKQVLVREVTPTCLTLECDDGYHCEQGGDVGQCVDTDGAPQATCLTLTCEEGNHCEMDAGHGVCVSNVDSAPTCAVLECQDGYHCEQQDGAGGCVAD